MEEGMGLPTCRLCNTDVMPPDMKECHGCWEVYSRLRGMNLELLKKLLIEAGVDLPNLLKTIRKEIKFDMCQNEKEMISVLGEALEVASSHLDFCGYGDSYERSIATESGVIRQVEDAKTSYKIWKEKNKK